ncbi:hypothetical protein BKA70DRAFT_1423022 [Coprinopsis sp. MPI-PUGE-AT-0042]|nr:hypothetical protein BKA70DRAFT_1423022 [Coprinopsis sp. MPI-PUGE-AT-0042]
MDDPAAEFICVFCWDSELPYPGQISGEYSIRTCSAQAKPEEAGGYLLRAVVFDFTNPSHVQRSIAQLIKELESPKHQGINRFLVSLRSHSDPDRGDIHTAPNNLRSAPLGEVLDFLLPTKLRTLFKRGGGSPRSIFMLHSCGYIVSNPQPLKALNTIASEGVFTEVVAFDQWRLQPALTYEFMTDACTNFFLYNRKSVTRVLPDHHVFGGHTGLVVFAEQGASRFLWCHPVTRPFGERISSQCKACMHADPGFKKERADPGSQKKANYDRRKGNGLITDRLARIIMARGCAYLSSNVAYLVNYYFTLEI